MKTPLYCYTDRELAAELSARAQRRQVMCDINGKTELIAHLLALAACEEAQSNDRLAARYRERADRETLNRNALCKNAVKES